MLSTQFILKMYFCVSKSFMKMKFTTLPNTTIKISKICGDKKVGSNRKRIMRDSKKNNLDKGKNGGNNNRNYKSNNYWNN